MRVFEPTNRVNSRDEIDHHPAVACGFEWDHLAGDAESRLSAAASNEVLWPGGAALPEYFHSDTKLTAYLTDPQHLWCMLRNATEVVQSRGGITDTILQHCLEEGRDAPLTSEELGLRVPQRRHYRKLLLCNCPEHL